MGKVGQIQSELLNFSTMLKALSLLVIHPVPVHALHRRQCFVFLGTYSPAAQVGRTFLSVNYCSLL